MLQLPQRTSQRIALLALSLLFVVAGINHFVSTAFYLSIMPGYLPAHLELVYLSGMLEVMGGVAVLIPKARAPAGWMLIALLIAVFPANLHMALNPTSFADIHPLALYIRLPLQGLLIGWAYWATRPAS